MTHPLVEAIQSAFQRRGWHCEPVANQLVLESTFEAHHTRVRVHAQAFPEILAISIVGYASTDVPPSRCGVVAEMLMRLNEQLTVGNFELHYDRGRVVFRVTHLFGSAPPAPEMITDLVHMAVAEIDRLTPFLTLVLRMDTTELSRLNLRLFLQREDLLPPMPTNQNSGS